MPDIQQFTLDLSNKGLLISQPGDTLPAGYLTNFLNLTANKTGFIESRGGTSLVSSTNLGSAVHSQGRIIIQGTAYIYQGAGTSLFRAFSSIATGFSGNPLVFREGGPDLAILPQEIVFDANYRYKDDGTNTTNFGIAGPLAMASASAAAATTTTIDAFQYATNMLIQAAWSTSNGTITTASSDPIVGTYYGNFAVNGLLTGTMTRTVSIDLSGQGDNDYISFYMAADVQANITEVRLEFDVDPSTNDYAHNYYWTSITSNLINGAVIGTQTANQAIQTVVTDPGQYVSPLDNPNPVYDTLPPSQLSPGENQWTQIMVLKSAFTRVGTSTNDWANVASVRISLQTNSGGPVNLIVSTLILQTGNNLNGTDYQWIYRYRNQNTQSTSPFSPSMTETVEIDASNAEVVVTNPRDPQVTHIDLYRMGGDTGAFSFVNSTVVNAYTGTVTILDQEPDQDLGDTDTYNLLQIELSNISISTSAIATSVQLTTNSGSTYTDETSNVSDGSQTTYMDLSNLNTLATNWFTVGADGQFRKVLIEMDANVNTVTSKMLMQYWNGTAWMTLPNQSDGTSVGGKTLAQGGVLSFDYPSDWAVGSVNSINGYYILISVSVQLSSAVHVTEIRLNANAFDPTVCETHGGRIWTDDSSHTNRVWYSERFGPEVFLTDNYIIGSNGGDPVVRPYALDEQLFIHTKSTVNRTIGTDSTSFDQIPTAAEVGLFSKYAICSGKGNIFYRAYDGLYAITAAGAPAKLTLALDQIFHGQPSEDGTVQPVNNAYALTETLEFFDSKLFFGYTDTNNNRQELILDLEVQRFEPTDRPATSYLRLDDVDEFYSGNSDGYVYQRYSGNTDNGSAIPIRFRSNYINFGDATRTKQITEIAIDANTNGQALAFYADFDNGTGTSLSTSVTNAARGILHFPMGDDTQCLNAALRLQSTNGGVLVQFYKITFFYIVLPSQNTKVVTEWDDLGYSSDKRLRQLQIEIDTGGSNVSVAVEGDLTTLETLTVNTAGRRYLTISLTDNLIATLTRLVITGASPFRYYRHVFESLRDPLTVTQYDTYELDFGYTRWKFIRRLWIAAITPGVVTIQIYVDEVLQYTNADFELTSPSGVGWTKTMIKLPPGLKGIMFRFIFTTSTGMKIYLDQSDVEFHPMADQRSYQRAKLARAT